MTWVLRIAGVSLLFLAYFGLWNASYELGQLADILMEPVAILVDGVASVLQALGFSFPDLYVLMVIVSVPHVVFVLGNLKPGVGWQAIGIAILLTTVWLLTAQNPIFWVPTVIMGLYGVFQPPQFSSYEAPEGIISRAFVAFTSVLFVVGASLGSYASALVQGVSRFPGEFNCEPDAAAISCAFYGSSILPNFATSGPNDVAPILVTLVFLLVVGFGAILGATHKLNMDKLVTGYLVSVALSAALAFILYQIEHDWVSVAQYLPL